MKVGVFSLIQAMKGSIKRGKRIVKYTRTQPPLTYSYGNMIPRSIEHRIEGNVRLTYVPILATDLETNKEYILTESEDEIELGDPGGPVATSLAPKNEVTRQKLKKEFLEQHANGELSEKGIPSGKSLVIYPETRERNKEEQRGQEVGIMAQVSGWETRNDPLSILNEKTRTFTGNNETSMGSNNEISGELLDLHPDEWDKSFNNKPDTKPQIICKIKMPDSQETRNQRPIHKTNEASGSRRENEASKKEKKVSNSDRTHYTETPKI
jgi:hypothetical protein